MGVAVFRPCCLNWGLIMVWVKVKLKSLSHVQLCDTMDCSPPGFSIPGILQARILEWVTISFSRAYSWPRDWTQVSCIGGRCFKLWATSNWDLPQKDLSKGKHSCIQCPSPCFIKFLDHASSGDSWTLTSNSGSVSFGNTALTLGSWWTQGFVCALQQSASDL